VRVPWANGRFRLWQWFGWSLVLTSLLFTAISFAGPSNWFADLFAHFRPQYLVALSLGALLLLGGRRWLPGSAAFVGALLNATLLMPRTSPSPPVDVEPGSFTIRCVSLNVLQGNTSYAKVEAFLREAGADVVLLQEVTPKWRPVLQRLRDVFPHQLDHARKDSKGAALLSRFAGNFRFEPFPGDRQIGALVGDLSTPAGPLTIYGIHSHKPTSPRHARGQREYFEWLARLSAEPGGPAIVAGDFNSTPWSYGFRAFTDHSAFTNTSRAVVFDATWCVGLPIQLVIDHAFTSPHWRLRSRKIGPAVGSDHRPLIVDLALSPSS
jgi:endonuclease/exonuclease/phosphatase (EEP) superfamily protein YafD